MWVLIALRITIMIIIEYPRHLRRECGCVLNNNDNDNNGIPATPTERMWVLAALMIIIIMIMIIIIMIIIIMIIIMIIIIMEYPPHLRRECGC